MKVKIVAVFPICTVFITALGTVAGLPRAQTIWGLPCTAASTGFARHAG